MISDDKKMYKEKKFIQNLWFNFNNNPKKKILKYIIYCRKCQFYKERKNKNLSKLLFIYYTRKKNKLGNKINLEINTGNFKKNLMIYHRNIVINPKAVIGENCKLHGNNCIGNNGNDKVPVIGDNVDIGFGAVLIGDIYIADGIIIGANALVNKSFYEKNIIIAGNPAKKIKEKGEQNER